MTNEQHNRYISWVFIAHAAFQGLIVLMMLVMFGIIISVPADPGPNPPPAGFFVAIFAFMFLFYLAFTVPSVIAAYGLRKKKKWARMASIIAGVLAAMNVPIGTAACVYALWFFLGDNWKEVYPDVADASHDTARTPLLSHERETRWTGYRQDERGEVTFQPVEPPDWR